MPAVIIPEVTFDFIGSDTDHLQKFREWLASHNSLIVQFNSLQELGQDVGSILTDIQGEIATFENYLANYDGVASVNGQSGVAVLTAADVGALAAAATAQNALRLGTVPAANFYHSANKPSKTDVGLNKVTNDTSFAHLMNSVSESINRAAKITKIVYWSAADVTYTLTSAGFVVGDEIYITKAYSTTGNITIVTDSGTITVVGSGTAAASQTLEAVGTICLTRITTSTFLARAA
jgi:hypothetical protein